MSAPLLTLPAAAERLAVSLDTVRRLVESGALPAQAVGRVGNDHHRFSQSRRRPHPQRQPVFFSTVLTAAATPAAFKTLSSRSPSRSRPPACIKIGLTRLTADRTCSGVVGTTLETLPSCSRCA